MNIRAVNCHHHPWATQPIIDPPPAGLLSAAVATVYSLSHHFLDFGEHLRRRYSKADGHWLDQVARLWQGLVFKVLQYILVCMFLNLKFLFVWIEFSKCIPVSRVKLRGRNSIHILSANCAQNLLQEYLQWLFSKFAPTLPNFNQVWGLSRKLFSSIGGTVKSWSKQKPLLIW